MDDNELGKIIHFMTMHDTKHIDINDSVHKLLMKLPRYLVFSWRLDKLQFSSFHYPGMLPLQCRGGFHAGPRLQKYGRMVMTS